MKNFCESFKDHARKIIIFIKKYEATNHRESYKYSKSVIFF